MPRLWMTLSGLFGAIGIAVAAWSTHGLPAIVPADELALAISRANTANQYLLLHALALLGVAVAQRQATSMWLNVAGALFVVGMLGFAGGCTCCAYWRASTGLPSTSCPWAAAP